MGQKSRSGWKYGIGYELKGRPTVKKIDRMYTNDTDSFQGFMKCKARFSNTIDSNVSRRSFKNNTICTKTSKKSKDKSKYFCNDSKQFELKKSKVPSNAVLNEDEAALLLKYIGFYHALKSGERKPTTDAQSHFVEVCLGHASPQTVHEIAYRKFLILKEAREKLSSSET
ncbi:MAG: DUF413 domain-containing protein [Syntrophobacteraceae bacterium]